MLKKSTLAVGIALFMWTAQSHAQLFGDAFRFGNAQYYASARSAAVGNALGALGGDVLAANVNPAGIGIYRVSEFTFTPMFSFNKSTSEFQNEKMDDTKGKFSLGNLGLVIASTPRLNTKFFQHGNFAITYNVTNYYHQEMSFSGLSAGTRLTNFVNSAQGLDYYGLQSYQPFDAQLAYDVMLIDRVNPLDNTYAAALTDANIVRKSQFQKQSGASREIALSYASHIKHKLYLGATLGIMSHSYKEFRSYEEFEETGSIDFKQMVFDENREVKGIGINLKLGAIYRINNIFKAGFHVHTPTSNNLTETYYTQMYGEVIYNGTLQRNTYDSEVVGKFKFINNTPWVLGLSGSGVFGTSGYFNIDAEYLTYNTMKFKTTNSDENSTAASPEYLSYLTDLIKGTYKGAFRLRAGGEYAFNVLRLRAGYQLQTSPYQVKLDGISDLQHTLSLGLGIRKESFFLDLAYSMMLAQYQYLPYAAESGSPVQEVFVKQRRGMLMATLGFRF